MPGKKKDGASKRTLVRWSDDLDKQLLLSIQYACNESGLRIPWDKVASLMGEKFSDGAIVQHMSKLRQKMVENDLPVPPPLKRGTTVVPSKIYATTGTSIRRKSMPETPTTATKAIETPTPKQSAGKKRGRRSGLDSDSDSQPDENDMDIADTSDEEYGASSRKKKKPQRPAKSKQATKKKTIQESTAADDEDVGQRKEEETPIKSQIVEEETIQESIETPGPASRTRGIRPDYSKLEQVSEVEDDGDGGDGKDEGAEVDADAEMMTEDETDDTKVKSDGDVSPRSKVLTSPVTPANLVSLSTYHNSPHSGNSAGMHTPYFGSGAQYHSPQNTFPGVPPTGYLPRSNMTSFSTNRNDSGSSLSSSVPQAFSSQSSFSHAPMGQMQFHNHAPYFDQSATDLNNIRDGLEHTMRHSGVFRSAEDDHDEFEHLFGHHSQP